MAVYPYLRLKVLFYRKMKGVLMDYKEIAIGVLKRGEKVCLTLRQSHQTFAGCWEFPGGKVAQEETIVEALQRELQEELGIETTQWQPLIVIPWRYKEVTVRLHVWVTETFSAEPVGCEGQKVCWVTVKSLSKRTFPEANRGIVTALQLPNQYMVSGGFDSNQDALLRLSNAFTQGVSLCQLRAKQLKASEFMALAEQVIPLAHSFSAKILLNGSPQLLQALPNADGIQLSSRATFNYDTRPIATDKLLGVSTHNLSEISQALKIGADFILLSPVNNTASHPELSGIGWQAFTEMVTSIPIPVFALGGMKIDDIPQAKQQGAQGVAAISGLWPESIGLE
jgi:8-oxo-dGTP diphosphatase